MANNPLLQAALNYAAKGFYVLPLKPQGKEPLTPNGYKNASIDTSTIVSWWSNNPLANIGIATGKTSNIFVVDIDGENIGKFSQLLPDKMNVKSFKGQHYYFKYPDNCSVQSRLRVHKLDVDIKSDGGYIVAPPSMHPSNTFYKLCSEEIHEASEELLSFIAVNESVPTPVASIPNTIFSEKDIEAMLSYLDPDTEYEDWLKVGMALHHDNRSVDLWVKWSSQGEKFQEGLCEKKWKGFSTNRETKVGIGTLVNLAQKRGYITPYKKEKLSSLFGYVDDLQKPLIKIYSWYDLEQLPPKKPLIKKLINKGEMCVLFGKSNTGKTFLALDIALHICLNLTWQGKKVKGGAVVYIAAEGGRGIKDRIKAFKQHYDLNDFPDFHIIPETVLLGKEASMLTELMASLKYIDDIQLIVIDTLARSIGGADENSSVDMGAFIKSCGILQNETGAHVMVVHHAGKDEARGARGHSSLKAAVDTEIQVSQKDGVITAEVTKQRDGETGEKFFFELKKYMLEQDEDGDFITSCVLTNVDQAFSSQRAQLSRQAHCAYLILQQLINEAGNENIGANRCVSIKQFKQACKDGNIAGSDKPDSHRRAFDRCKNSLVSKGYAGEEGEYIWLMDKPDNDGRTFN